ncbi:hypothetical protein CWB56_18470 [Pseudoalteromonas sp. S185]|nr:hypothetical protein CWB56_18470 [Pseudoalteromonas sp. S185]
MTWSIMSSHRVATCPYTDTPNRLSPIQTDDFTPTDREWLFEPGSLTAKVKSNATSFSVKLLSDQ